MSFRSPSCESAPTQPSRCFRRNSQRDSASGVSVRRGLTDFDSSAKCSARSRNAVPHEQPMLLPQLKQR